VIPGCGTAVHIQIVIENIEELKNSEGTLRTTTKRQKSVDSAISSGLVPETSGHIWKKTIKAGLARKSGKKFVSYEDAMIRCPL
jgi:hypothetical protein